MSKRFAVALTMIVGFAALALAQATPAANLETVASTVEAIVARNVAARGGLDAWRAVRSLRMSGRMDVGQGLQAPFTLQLKRPRKMRLEFVFDGQMVVQAYDGNAGWKRQPYLGRGGFALMDAEELERAAAQAELEGPLIDYRAKGHAVELVGQEVVEDREAFKLEVNLSTGAVRHLYLDAETFLEVKVDGTRQIRGEEKTLETFFRDYKRVGGLLVPHTLETRLDGAPSSQSLLVDAVELNPKLADGLFAPPAS